MPKVKDDKKKKAAPKKRRASNCKIIIDDDFLSKVEAMAARGNTQEQIAWNLGICPTTLSKKKSANDQLSQAIKRGQAKGITQVSNQLYLEATKTENRNMTAILFYLCNRDKQNWRHISNIQHEDMNAGLAELIKELINNKPS